MTFANGFTVTTDDDNDLVIVSYKDKVQRYRRSDFTDEQYISFLTEIENTVTTHETDRN